MSAPDFYFAVNETFRHIHDNFGKAVLVDYWRSLGRDHYRDRNARWRAGGAAAIAEDWQNYFDHEPGADVSVAVTGSDASAVVELDIRVCPAIAHIRKHDRDLVPYFCEHCDHVCGAQAEAAGYEFQREGGMGSCQQRFVPMSVKGGA